MTSVAQTLSAARRKLSGFIEQASAVVTEIDSALRQIGVPSETAARAPRPAGTTTPRRATATSTKRTRTRTAAAPAANKNTGAPTKSMTAAELTTWIATHPGLTQSQITERTGLRPNIAGRQLVSLVKKGVLTTTAEGNYNVAAPDQAAA